MVALLDCACPIIPTTPSHLLMVCRTTARSTMLNIRTLFETMATTFLVLCVWCMPTKDLVLIMVSGKSSCPAGFTREHYGYLMSERVHVNHHRSTFECVDKNLESVHGSSQMQYNGLFGHVEAVCNALPCPPYNNYKEINCAMCTM